MNTVLPTDNQDQNTAEIAAWIETLDRVDRATLEICVSLFEAGASHRQADRVVRHIRTVRREIAEGTPDQNATAFNLYDQVYILPGKGYQQHVGQIGMVVEVLPTVPGLREDGSDVPEQHTVYFKGGDCATFYTERLSLVESIEATEHQEDEAVPVLTTEEAAHLERFLHALKEAQRHEPGTDETLTIPEKMMIAAFRGLSERLRDMVMEALRSAPNKAKASQ